MKYKVYIGKNLKYESDDLAEAQNMLDHYRPLYTRFVPIFIETEPEPETVPAPVEPPSVPILPVTPVAPMVPSEPIRKNPDAVTLGKTVTARKSAASRANIAKINQNKKPCTCGQEPHRYNCPGYARAKQAERRARQAAR